MDDIDWNKLEELLVKAKHGILEFRDTNSAYVAVMALNGLLELQRRVLELEEQVKELKESNLSLQYRTRGFITVK